MTILNTRTIDQILVSFDATEAGELRAIGHLPPCFERAPAELWLTADELLVMSEILPISREFAGKIRKLLGELPP